MIEMRWLAIELHNLLEHPTAIITGTASQVFVRVLQIRTREGPREDGWWGEWHDVPLVYDEKIFPATQNITRASEEKRD
jgi:hypothetical protein